MQNQWELELTDKKELKKSESIKSNNQNVITKTASSLRQIERSNIELISHFFFPSLLYENMISD